MKYIFFPFLLLWLVSCSIPNPFSDNPVEKSVPDIDIKGVRISDSGVSVSGDDGNISADNSGNILIGNGSGNISIGDDGTSVISGSDTVIIRKNGMPAGTGAMISNHGTDDMEKDPEIQSIAEDIDKIFSDIEKWGN